MLVLTASLALLRNQLRGEVRVRAAPVDSGDAGGALPPVSCAVAALAAACALLPPHLSDGDVGTAVDVSVVTDAISVPLSGVLERAGQRCDALQLSLSVHRVGEVLLRHGGRCWREVE